MQGQTGSESLISPWRVKAIYLGTRSEHSWPFSSASAHCSTWGWVLTTPVPPRVFLVWGSDSDGELLIRSVKHFHCQKVNPAKQTTTTLSYTACCRSGVLQPSATVGFLSCHIDYHLPSLARSQSFSVVWGGRRLRETQSSGPWWPWPSCFECPRTLVLVYRHRKETGVGFFSEI